MSILSTLHALPTLLLLVLLTVFTCGPSAVVAQVRPGCANKYQCPKRETRQCGVFYNCMPGSTANIEKASITVCGSCSYNEPKAAFASVCNFQYGRCVPNTIDGKVCTAPAQCTAPGVTEFSCRPVKSNKKLSRCCRTKCPPGMCGARKKPLKYTNACGEQIVCPGVCPQ
ncbi:hypothetical protein CLOP_g7139 [Closterium sp. NIES-67]|nr:hypothetical protein CLOP_g7139 [Closterium sp. NIES-67]